MTATYWEIGCRIVGSEQQGSSGRNTERLLLSNSLKIWSLVLAGLWMAQPYANADVLPGVAGLEDFADTVYKICPSSGIGSKAPFTLVGLRASALGSESSVACGSTRPKALRSGWSIRQRAKFAR